FAQFKEIKVPQHLLDRIEIMPEVTPDPAGLSTQTSIIGQKYNEAIIGTTWHDLQSYGSMHQRAYTYSDGTIGATWMMGFQTPDWPDRGIGYNFYDGNEWDSYPTESIMSERTGWACYAPLGENGEVAVGHALPGDDWTLLFAKRETKGSGDWVEFSREGPTTGVGIVWPEMITSTTDNNTIHLLARTYGDIYNDQDGALLYYRSTDGGDSWDIENYFFDELGSDYYTSIGADAYNWANAKGDVIAFAVGFEKDHGIIMKSMDNGESWEAITCYESPFSPYQGGATPDFGLGDGSVACAIDSENNVHVAFGKMVHNYDEAGTGYYFPATEGLIYWNENMDPLDTTIISSYTQEFLINNNNLIGWIIPNNGDSTILDLGIYYQSLTTFPRMLIDENDRIFVIYSGLAAGYDNGIINYHHICANSSLDGGETWKGIVDLNTELVYIFSECVYPVLSPTIIDAELHLFFQEDSEPGIFVWTAQQGTAGNNNIIYMPVDVYTIVGINENNTGNNAFLTSTIYPNPFRKFTWFEVSLNEQSNVTLQIRDITGKLIYTLDPGLMADGVNRFKFENQNLSPGVYFYTLTSGNEYSTGKMIVQ
ncbi:MAG: T9SS type A sorting domain-containing protein, partial [Bacteroidales bacterium]|nr:T9SS type A sorting domain-containing protein [Bacteroidales bacterium]